MGVGEEGSGGSIERIDLWPLITNKQYFKLRKNVFFLISSLTFKNISGIYNDF